MTPIYLDYQATTPLDPRVLATMQPYLAEDFGNAASHAHAYGQRAAEAVAAAREEIAQAINGSPLGLVFTSGATESINLALKGLAEFYGPSPRDHIITCVTEHPAVRDCCVWLETKGFRVTVLPVDSGGHLDLDQVAEAMDDRTLALSVMAANNETGVLHNVAALGALAKEKGVFFHCDAVQALGRVPIDVETMGIDLLSISGHKIYGPKGVGALWLRRKHPRVRLVPQMHGGGHERGFRSGTLNVPAIVGLAHALKLCLAERGTEERRFSALRDHLFEGLTQEGISFELNGDPVKRLACNLNLRFPGVSAARLMAATPQLALSRGSACTSAVPSPSRVLLAMGLDARAAAESLRISLGRMTTAEDLETVLSSLVSGVELAREDSS